MAWRMLYEGGNWDKVRPRPLKYLPKGDQVEVPLLRNDDGIIHLVFNQS